MGFLLRLKQHVCKHKRVESTFIARPKIKKQKGSGKPVVFYNVFQVYRCYKCKVFMKEIKVKSDLTEKQTELFYKEKNIDYSRI